MKVETTYEWACFEHLVRDVIRAHISHGGLDCDAEELASRIVRAIQRNEIPGPRRVYASNELRYLR